MQHQEALLVEVVDQVGYDIRKLDCYKPPEEKNEPFNERYNRIQVEQNLVSSSEKHANARNNIEEYEDEDEDDTVNNVNNSPNRLSRLSALANEDKTVESYVSLADLPVGCYPRSFDNKYPPILLKALCHAT
jgi:hypothetical protein